MPWYRVTWEVTVDALDERHAIEKAEYWRDQQGSPHVEMLPDPDDDEEPPDIDAPGVD